MKDIEKQNETEKVEDQDLSLNETHADMRRELEETFEKLVREVFTSDWKPVGPVGAVSAGDPEEAISCCMSACAQTSMKR